MRAFLVSSGGEPEGDEEEEDDDGGTDADSDDDPQPQPEYGGPFRELVVEERGLSIGHSSLSCSSFF